MDTLDQILRQPYAKTSRTSVMQSLLAAYHWIKASFKRRMTEYELERLSDHHLRDIGVNREDLRQGRSPLEQRRRMNKIEMMVLLHRG